MHEIVTLQFGQQVNYLGTHFWNAQESYFTYGPNEESLVNHDVSFRSGVGADGSDTYLPRTVIYDFKASFGTLRKINDLYEVLNDDQRHSNTWYDIARILLGDRGGNVSTQLQPALTQNEYQRALNAGLESGPVRAENVRFWSDYSRVYYHPRSIVQIYESDINPEHRAFDEWQIGEELFAALDAEHDLLDRDLRPFLEECDQLQGLQILTSMESGWSAFATRYVDKIHDELGKSSLWVWTLGEGPANTISRRRAKFINEARALSELSTQSSIYIPLTGNPISPPGYVKLNTHMPWQTGALQMTGFESFTLPSRLNASRVSGAASLDDLAMAIDSAGNRNIAELSFCVSDVDNILPEDRMAISGYSGQASKACNLFPLPANSANSRDNVIHSEVEAYRGLPSRRGSSMNGQIGQDGENEHAFRRFESELDFPLLDSFPPIYSLTAPSTRKVSVQATVKTLSRTAAWVRMVASNSRQLIGFEEREALMNGLQEIAEKYETRFSDELDDWD